MIPTHADQPTNSFYNAVQAGHVRARARPRRTSTRRSWTPASSVGSDPIAGELKSRLRHGRRLRHALAPGRGQHLRLRQHARRRCEAGPTRTGPSYINTFQRGAQESVWETVPQPTCDAFKYGGKNGYLDLFTGDSSYAKQWKYTDAPDADARAIQAAYWADTWAKAQGKGGDVSATVAKAAQDGRLPAVRRCSTSTSRRSATASARPPARPAPARTAAHYLLSWYYAWGGATDTSGGWAWRIG